MSEKYLLLSTKEILEEIDRLFGVLEIREPPAKIHSPADVYLHCKDMADLGKEELRVLLLNTRNKIKSSYTLYIGSVNSAQIRIAEVFTEAIKQNEPSLIVVHNHPSGDPNPSPDDVAFTHNLVQAGKMLGIDVLDHVVIGNGRYVSLKERGLGFG